MLRENLHNCLTQNTVESNLCQMCHRAWLVEIPFQVGRHDRVAIGYVGAATSSENQVIFAITKLVLHGRLKDESAQCKYMTADSCLKQNNNIPSCGLTIELPCPPEVFNMLTVRH